MRRAIMKDGAVVEAGPTAPLFRAMSHPYTRSLFAASTHRPERDRRPLGEPVLEVREAVRDYVRSLSSRAGSGTRVLVDPAWHD